MESYVTNSRLISMGGGGGERGNFKIISCYLYGSKEGNQGSFLNYN